MKRATEIARMVGAILSAITSGIALAVAVRRYVRELLDDEHAEPELADAIFARMTGRGAKEST